MNIQKYTEVDLPQIAQRLIAEFGTHKVWCFEAEMGAGKTSLIKSLCHVLGAVNEMSSPTFSIVNEYRTMDGAEIYHFDFYRLEHEGEALNIGIEDYFFSGNQCFIEWPDVISGFLPDEYLKITINLVCDSARSLIARPV